MCYYAAIVVPAKDAAWFESIEWRGGISRSRPLYISPALTNRLGHEWKGYWVGGSDCACGWFYPSEHADPDRDAKLWKKFAKKGWSEAKTRRAFEQAGGGNEPEVCSAGFRQPLPEHVAAVVQRAGVCGMIAEEPDADKGEGNFAGGREARCSIDDFTTGKVEFVAGVLYWVSAGVGE